MIDTKIINSNAYWDNRFDGNWDVFEGPRQSRFFARVAIEHTPNWLISQLRRQSLTLADWGCAQGDGTDVWASYIDAQQITGVDFSPVAIKQAIQRYPAIHFVSEDWLAGSCDEKSSFDVIFSSNTLEHFYKPYDALLAICKRAEKAIVLALPYMELERIDEHFYSFLPGNIPAVLPNGFKLVWSQVVDCRNLPNTMWPGSQIVLVYAAQKWVDGIGLTLADCCIEQIDSNSEISSLIQAVTERDRQITSLNQAVAERDSGVAERESERDAVLAERDAVLAERDAVLAERDAVLAERDAAANLVLRMRTSRSWRITRPLRFAARVCRHGLLNDDKQRLVQAARERYHRLPLPASVKRLFSFTYHKALSKGIRRLQRTALQPSQFIAPLVAPSSQLSGVPDYIMWGVIDWHFRHQRPQQLALALVASGRRLFYVSPNHVDDERAGFEVEALDASGMIFQIRLYVKGATSIYSAAPSQETVRQLSASIGEVMIWARNSEVVSLVQHPLAKTAADTRSQPVRPVFRRSGWQVCSCFFGRVLLPV